MRRSFVILFLSVLVPALSYRSFGLLNFSLVWIDRRRCVRITLLLSSPSASFVGRALLGRSPCLCGNVLCWQRAQQFVFFWSLLRTVMAVAASANDIEPRKISFKGAKQALMAFARRSKPRARGACTID